MENKIKFSREEQKDFNFWKQDGNVSKNEDGSYSTQDSQWTNRLKDLDALKQYYYKEFLSNRPRYAGGGRTMKNRAKKQAIKDIKSNLWRPQAPYQSVEKPSEEWERYELPYDTKLQYDFEPDSFSVQGKRYSEYAKGGEIKVNGMTKQDYIDAYLKRVDSVIENLKQKGQYDSEDFDLLGEVDKEGGFTEIEDVGYWLNWAEINGNYDALIQIVWLSDYTEYDNYQLDTLAHFFFGKPIKIDLYINSSGDSEYDYNTELQKIKLLLNKIDFDEITGEINYEEMENNTDLKFYKNGTLVMSLNGDWNEESEELHTTIDIDGETTELNYHPLDSMGGVNMQQLKKNINEAFKELNTYSAVVSIEGYEEYAEDVEGLENAKSVIQNIKGNTRFQVLKGSSVGIGKRVDNSRVVEEYAKGGEAGFDDTGTSMAMYHEKKGNFMVAKGQVYLWFYDVENSAKKIESGEFDYVLYPFSSLSMMGQRGFIPPLKKIWTKKFQKQTKGSEHLLGVIKAFLIEEDGKKELYIDMMSVNPTKKKKGVMSYMIKDLRNAFDLTQDQVTFSNLTEDGKKFVVKKTYADGGQPVQYIPVQQMPQQPVQYVPVQQMPQQSPQQPVNSPLGNLDINSAINFVKENPQVLALLKDGGEASEFKKGGNVSSIEKRVAEVNALIKEGNDKGVQVIDKTTTWEAPMKYNPIKYTNGVLYVSYKQLDLYKYKKGMGSEWKNESYRIGKNEMGENISRGSAQTDALSYIARMYRSAINDFNKYGYDVGGRVKTKEYFQIFKLENLLDKTELLLTEEELNRFISKWNLDNLTDYADWVEFNEYEDYKRITPVFSKNEYGGNVNNSFVESEINSVSTWENEEIATYLEVPVNEVAKHRDYYVEETQNAMLVNQVDGDYAGGGGVKLKNNNINWVKNVGEEGWSKDMAYKNAYENSGGYISTSGNWQIYRDGRFYYDKDMGGDNYKRDGDWIVRRNDEFYGEFDSLIEAKEYVENWVRINPKDYAGGGIIEVVGKGNKGSFRKREYEGMTEKEVANWWIERGYTLSKSRSENKLKPYTFYIQKYADGGEAGYELENYIISGKNFKNKYATDFNGQVAKVIYTKNLDLGSNLGKGSYWNVTQDSLDIYSGKRDEELDSKYGQYFKNTIYKKIDDNLKIFVKDEIADELWDNEKLYNKIKNISDGIYDPSYDDYGLLLFENQYADGGNVPHADKMFQLPLEMVIYVPSTQDVDKVISVDKMDKRVDEVKKYLANKFGGYTSADKLGGFVDSTGNLVNEDVVQVTSFSTKKAYAENKEELINQLAKWGEEWGQESIGFEFEGDLMYVPQKFKQGGGVDKFSDYSNDALSDMIINLSRYENTEKEIQIVKAELKKRKGENKDIEE